MFCLRDSTLLLSRSGFYIVHEKAPLPDLKLYNVYWKIFLTMNETDADIILFDGVCNLCNGLVRFIIKRDKRSRFKFASLQSDIGQQWLKRFDLIKNEFDSFILIRGDQYYL